MRTIASAPLHIPEMLGVGTGRPILRRPQSELFQGWVSCIMLKEYLMERKDLRGGEKE